MSMPRRATLLAALILLMAVPTPFATAQTPGILPGVEISCQYEESAMQWQIWDQSTVSVNCEIENPTIYNEEIEIEYDVDTILVAGPESVTIAGGETLEIMVSLNQGSASDTPIEYNITVTASVTSVQGIEWSDFLSQFAPSDESNILLEVPEFVEIAVTGGDGTPPVGIELNSGGGPNSASITVTNNGNVAVTDVWLEADSMISTNSFFQNLNFSFMPSMATIEAHSSLVFTVTITPVGDLEDGGMEVGFRPIGPDGPLGNGGEMWVNTTAPEESILDLSAMNIPTWAYIAAGTLGILFLFAIVVSISKRAKAASQSILDEMEDEDDDDFDLADLDDALSDEQDDDDDLDDIDLDDFEF